MQRLTRAVVVGAVLWILGEGFATAAPAEAEDFDELIHRGVQLRKQGDDHKAEELFLRAYSLAQTPRAAAQLGLVEYALSNFEEAERRLTEALATQEPWIEAHRKALEDSRTEVRRHLARVDVVGVAPGTTVVLGDERPTKFPANGTFWLSPGHVSVKIEPSGSNPVMRSAEAKAGDHMTLDFSRSQVTPTPPVAPPPAPAATIPPPPGPETPTAPSPHDSKNGLRIAGIATGAGGLVLAVTGAVLYEVAGTKLAHINSHSYSNSDLDWQTYDRAGVGLMVGGGVAIAVGATFYLLGHRQQSEGIVSVGFVPGSGSGAAILKGSF